MLTQERLKESLDYDPETGIFTWRVRASNRVRVGSQAGSKKTDRGGKTYVQIRMDGVFLLAHRLAFLWMEGSVPEDQTDHEDGDGTNNRWSNLKRVTHQQNGRNRRRRGTNMSGVTGVCWHKQARKWQARIQVAGRACHLGLFTVKEEAISTRKAAELEHNYHPNHGSDRPL
jgi:hypothetical protein